MVAGNYELTRVIGVGGMGGVFAAHDEILNREVAVKLILPELVKDAAAVARIRREAVLTAKLRHPGIVEVFAAGHDVDGAFYIVQEFLHGDTLRRVIATETHADTRVLNARMIGILEPMAHVHRANVIHRDIKPDNIIITRDPHTGLERPKIIDLGIGKQLSVALAGNALTANATVIGTIGYMSPEQAKGASDLDARTDVWSLGVTFYEMYAGRWPWTQADNQIAVISSILTDPIPDIREVSRGVFAIVSSSRDLTRPA